MYIHITCQPHCLVLFLYAKAFRLRCLVTLLSCISSRLGETGHCPIEVLYARLMEMVSKVLYLNALCLLTLQFPRTSTSNQQYQSVGFIVDVGSGMTHRLAQQLEQELKTALQGNMSNFSRYALALVSRQGQMVR